MEVVVMGGHVIVGVNINGIASPGLATCSRMEIVVGSHVHERMYVIVRWA